MRKRQKKESYKIGRKKIELSASQDSIRCIKKFAEHQSALLGKFIHHKTMRRLLKNLGFSWKRMRKSLKQQRDEGLFRLFEQELKLLTQMAERGAIDLYYFDGSGFNLNPNVPYSWSKKGKQALLPAIRSKGYTILGLLNVQNNSFEGNIYNGAANAKCVVQTLGELADKIQKKTIVILDNASIHKALIVKNKIKTWRAKGLFLQFIPAYSPELNLIEILWRFMKHYWLDFQAYENLEQLRIDIIKVLQKYGSHYTINFG